MVTITITLQDGSSYSKTYARRPRFWKSEALRLAPYGSDRQGCKFSIATA